MVVTEESPQTIKELCSSLGKSRTYLHAVKKDMESLGLRWPNNQMSPDIIREFVARTGFNCTRYAKRAKRGS